MKGVSPCSKAIILWILYPVLGMFWGWNVGPLFQDSSAAQPVVLMSIGIDLEDLHRTEVTEHHHFLPHLPPDLPKIFGRHRVMGDCTLPQWNMVKSRKILHWRRLQPKNWEFHARFFHCYRVDLPACLKLRNPQKKMQYIDGKSANPPISAQIHIEHW